MSPAYRSFAKINRHLQVVGRRGDGYHELRTVFQTIDLHDELRFRRRSEGVSLAVSGADLPAGPDNLVHRAATEYLSRWGSGGVEVELLKRIPAGGGLGGGSGDAATTLLALRDLYGEPADFLDLWPIARGLGADVPYFLVGGAALGVGRGDEIVPLVDPPEEVFWLALPEVHVSTANVFNGLPEIAPAETAPAVLAWAQGRPPSAGSKLWNDLQDPVLRGFREVEQVYNSLARGGFESVQVSGSGGCMFARWPGPGEPGLDLSVRTRLLRTRTLTREAIRSLRRID
jgi:4-diphosphocytidyl-2-C-methyl-D-erythritol kinase